MARIRTIKPEFPQSESMGNVSRDARLLFIQLFTVADDEGRGRGAAPMLARLLFPYDDDAPKLIGEWIAELERVGCVKFYQVDGSNYFQIINWASHQKIDKPTPSKFPAPTGEIATRTLEREIEISLFDAIKKSGEIFGEKLLDVQRQVRVGSLYLDIVATGESSRFVIEVKRERLSVADLRQVIKYADATGCYPVLFGAGLSPQFPLNEARESGVAVIIFDGETANLAIPSDHVTNCSITLASVGDCSITVVGGSRIKDQGEEGKGIKPSGQASPDPALEKTDDPPEPPAPPTPPPKETGGRKKKEPGPSMATWEAYAEAFKRRYGTDALRNAKISSLLTQFIQRVPLEEAPHIARFYVSSNSKFYVDRLHPIELLLRDAEKIRTEWATGRNGGTPGVTKNKAGQTSINGFVP